MAFAMHEPQRVQLIRTRVGARQNRTLEVCRPTDGKITPQIVAVGGNVTLNGVVRSQEEKDSIQSKAQAVVSSGSVMNNLKIAPPK